MTRPITDVVFDGQADAIALWRGWSAVRPHLSLGAKVFVTVPRSASACDFAATLIDGKVLRVLNVAGRSFVGEYNLDGIVG